MREQSIGLSKIDVSNILLVASLWCVDPHHRQLSMGLGQMAANVQNRDVVGPHLMQLSKQARLLSIVVSWPLGRIVKSEAKASQLSIRALVNFRSSKQQTKMTEVVFQGAHIYGYCTAKHHHDAENAPHLTKHVV